jgi:hypothetical protein
MTSGLSLAWFQGLLKNGEAKEVQDGRAFEQIDCKSHFHA